jgi:predicted TIM-barrel fold metal-dependent hydrolase
MAAISDSQPSSGAPIIDCHAHVYLKNMPLVPNATNVPEADHPPEQYLAVLKAAGVKYGVLTAPSFLGTDNSYLRAALRAFPQFRGTAIVDPTIDEATLTAMAKEGVVGIRFSLNRYPELPDLSSATYRKLFDKLGSLGLFIHLFVESSRIEKLLPPLLDSGVRLLLDHFGTTSGSGVENSGLKAVQRAVGEGKAWVKFSAANRTGGADVKRLAKEYLAAGGPERVVWGSDWPWVGHPGIKYQDTLTWFEEWVPDPNVRAAIGKTGMLFHRVSV